MKWLLFSMIAIVGWGLWGFFTKMASRDYTWYQIFFVAQMVTFISACIVFLRYLHQPHPFYYIPRGFLFILASGALGAIAIYGFYNAIQYQKVSIIVPMTSLYPIITIVLSHFFLEEKLSLTQGVGIVLALIAIILLSLS